MKSLAVLGAIFFPGTFVAVSILLQNSTKRVLRRRPSQSLFSMNSLNGQPFWMYWAITTPLTVIVLGVWVFWTRWRGESVKEQELRLDEKAIG